MPLTARAAAPELRALTSSDARAVTGGVLLRVTLLDGGGGDTVDGAAFSGFDDFDGQVTPEPPTDDFDTPLGPDHDAGDLALDVVVDHHHDGEAPSVGPLPVDGHVEEGDPNAGLATGDGHGTTNDGGYVDAAHDEGEHVTLDDHNGDHAGHEIALADASFVGPLPDDAHVSHADLPVVTFDDGSHEVEAHEAAAGVDGARPHAGDGSPHSDETVGGPHTDAPHVDDHGDALHADDHGDAATRAEGHGDAALHAEGDATHAEGHTDVGVNGADAAHDSSASHADLDPEHHEGVLSVEVDQNGHTVTHFADGSSATVDEHGAVIAFTEPHHASESDPAHAPSDPHANGGDAHNDAPHHSDVDPSHPDTPPAASAPASLVQSPNVGDCFVVSTLNEIAARPGGMEYLRSLVTDRGDGIYEVTLQGPNGPETVLVQNNGTGASTPGPNQADNVVLQVLEQGIGASRSEGYGGNRPDDGIQSITLGATADSVFTQLGLTDVQSNGTMQDILKDQDRVPVDVNTVLDHIAAGDPVTLGTFSDGWRLFDLTPNHEYSIGAVITDELGIPAIVFNNPDGTHSKPVPITALNDAGTLTWGKIPGVTNGTPTTMTDPGPGTTGTPSITATGDTGPTDGDTTGDESTDTTDTYTYGNDDAGFDWDGVGYL